MDSFWMANGFVGLPDPIEDTHRGSLLIYPFVTLFPPRLLSLLEKLGPNLSTTSPIFLSIHTHFALNDQLPRSPSGPPSFQILTLHLISMTMIPPMSTFPASHSPQSLLAGPHNQSRQYSSQSLSIGTKLFAPMEMDGEADEEMLVTAKPKELVGTLDPTMVLESLESLKKEKAENCKRKVSHARKQTADHIPRSPNAFNLFRKHVVDAKLIPASVEMRHQNVSIVTAKMWSEASAEQKAHFNELTLIEKEEHMKKYLGHRYQPVYRRTNVVRRRVRKDEAEEEKCKNVAELLIALSRRPNGACELFKGALRALRAHARQRQQSFNSGDWSDLSSSTSIDPDAQGSRQRQYSAFEMIKSLQSPEPDAGSHHQGLAPWSSDVPAELNKEQAFTLTSAQQDFQPDQQDPFKVSITSHSYPSTSRHFLYPQPQPQFQLTIMSDQQATNEFYAHDAALLFSPPACQFTFQDQSNGMHIDAMPIFDVGSTQQQVAHPPISARWDKGHLLPPSSDVPLEGLPFDDGLILGDFEAALAHADDMIGGVWQSICSPLFSLARKYHVYHCW
ncbi:uncharacterized protein IAS62_002781 [Cryptococcus decagattii]|uniref:HMG box domain-containing protein n=1 Tax=Cryptococcus decagattii TaxID=1859122 RepID=A0ABZ2ASJ2_9TREE